ncbi:MAG: site-specific DNA-methyltransferase, partial [Helicobacteraceae bacterium]|nr:site-specific DNA-methyltransferase [Helicobacteraceae bacterium]
MAHEEQKTKGGGVGATFINNDRILPNSAPLNTLKTHFPQFFDTNDNFKTDKFLEELKANNINEARDGYRLSFIGKDYARLQTGRASETMIVPDREHNEKSENKNSGNIFITGDNLEALRHLQNAYANKIKMIYIDPPYNTGQEFTYSDSFEFNDEKLKSALNYNDDEIARLKSIQGKSSHSAWLTFMYPRLKIAQKLLRDDGVIFVSIDDNEQANLKLLMDDIFGERNFIVMFLWNKTATPPSLSIDVRKKYEYILCYQRANKRENGLVAGEIEGGDMPLLNESNNERKLIFDKKAVNFKINGQFCAGIYDRVELLEDIEIENGKSKTDLKLKGKFKWVQSTLETEISNGTIFWIKTSKFAIRYERNETGAKTPSNIINKIECNVGTNEDANKEIKELFHDKVIFDFLKPTSLINYFIKMVTDKNSLILDFFAGSGTTAHAVMQLNAEDGGDRKYIMVQLNEPTNENSEARKAGYNTIDEIARERIKRAAQKIKSEAGLNAQELDLGFKHFRLVNPDAKTIDKIIEFDSDNASLFNDDMITPFAYPETKTSGLDTLLATWLISDGFAFSAHVEAVNFANYQAYYIKDAAML